VSPDDWARIIAIIPSIVLHEVSHGFVANHFGDDTAKRAGRLTLNPVAHVDPFGTIVLPILLSLTSLGAFGYAKPVPVNPARLRRPRQHSLYVSLAGPGTNIALAVVAALLFRTLYGSTIGFDTGLSIPRFLFWLGFVNVVLAVFNLLPIPPLDGSALIERVLPREWWPTWLKVRQYGFGILLVLLFLLPGVLDRIFDPALEQWYRLL
jgi:Zn-dependent protease